MENEVLTVEHLEALKDLWTGLYPVFDLELFKVNNPFFSPSSFLTPPTNDNTIAIKTT